MGEQIIKVTDSSTGIEKEYEILYTFSSNIYNHDYIVMFEKDYTGEEVDLHIVIYKDEALYSIEDEQEWNLAHQTVLDFLHDNTEE